MEDTAGILDHWDALVTDMEALVEELERSGRAVIEIFSATAVPIHGPESEKANGLSVTIPDDKFDELAAAIAEDEDAFDSYRVYRKLEGEFVILAVVMEDATRDLAVVFPAYYRERDGLEMIRQALADGVLCVHLRRLANERLTFSFDEPELFAPF